MSNKLYKNMKIKMEMTLARQTGKGTMDKRSVLITCHLTETLRRIVRGVTLASEQDMEGGYVNQIN